MVDEYPWSFISGTYQLANKAVGVVLAESDSLAPGFIGIMKDSSIVFTAAGGAVQLRILHRGGGTTIFTSNFTTTATGLNAIMNGSGDRLQLVVATQNASGIVDVNLHGVIQENVTGKILRDRTMLIPQYEGVVGI